GPEGSGLSTGNRPRDRIHFAIALTNCAGRNQSGAGRGDKRRGYKTDQVIILVNIKLEIVRNPKHPVAATDYCLLIQTVSEPDSRSKLLLRQRQIVPRVVHAGFYQKYVSWTGTSRRSGTACHGTICHSWIPVRQSVEAIGPRPLQLPAKSQIQRQLAGRTESVIDKKGTIRLFPRGQIRNLGCTFCMVEDSGLVLGQPH